MCLTDGEVRNISQGFSFTDFPFLCTRIEMKGLSRFVSCFPSVSEVSIPNPGDHSTLLVSFHLKRHMGDFVIQVTTNSRLQTKSTYNCWLRCTAPACCWWWSPGSPSGSTGRPPQTGSRWASPQCSPWPSWASRLGRTCPRWLTPPPWTTSSSSLSCTSSPQLSRWRGTLMIGLHHRYRK